MTQRFLLGFLLVLWFLPSARADISFTAPSTSGENLAYCSDYFLDNWGIRLNMSGKSTGVLQDIPTLAYSGIDGLNYTNGVLSVTSIDSSPRFTFLQYTVVGSIPVGTRYGEMHPVDSSKYKILTFRMYSSQATTAQFRWFHTHDRWAITNISINKGWHTYQVDLSTAPVALSSGANIEWGQGSPQGLELLPANSSGVNSQLDWLMLTQDAGSCSTYTVNYTATADGNDNYFALFLDDDNDYTNGYIETLASGAASGAASAGVNAVDLFPGTYNVYGILSGEWASLQLLNPFDMSDSEDINSSLSTGIGNPSFSGGKFSGTTTHSDPSFYLNIRNGKTINSAIYRSISVGIDIDLPTGVTTEAFQLFFFNSTSSAVLGSVAAFVSEGTNTLNFDMSGASGWSGEIGAIRIDPVNREGVNFALDYVAIKTNGYVSSLSAPTASSASGTIKVNDISLNVLKPDKAGGLDFAQSTLNNAWNMDSAADVNPIYNVSAAYIYPFNTLTDATGASNIGNYLYAQNVPNGNGDSNYFSIFRNAEVDTSRFVNVCFRAWNSLEELNYNSVARVLWQDPRDGATDSSYRDGDDIIMNAGVQTYCLDMRNTADSKLEPELPSGSPNPWTSIGESGYKLNYFRIDLNENSGPSFYSVMDYITVRADHEANQKYAIVVEAASDKDVNLYYNSSKSTSGGTLIGSLSAGRQTNVFSWDTSAVTEGYYYIYASITSNDNTLSRLGSGRVHINHSLTQDSAAPILVCERPSNGGYTFDSQLELAGYALDDTRLAALEVLVDNVYLTSVTPSQFHYGAATAYPNYAEANAPGFQVVLDASSISAGPHAVKLVATDINGNTSNCEISTTKINGGDTAPLEYPTPNGSAIALEVTASESTPSLSLSVSKKKNFNIAISNLSGCSSVSVLGSTLSSLASPVTIFNQVTSESSVNLEAKAVSSFSPKKTKKIKKKKARKSKEDGKIFLQAKCGNTASSTQAFALKRIKNKRKVSKEAAFIKQLVKKVAVK